MTSQFSGSGRAGASTPGQSGAVQVEFARRKRMTLVGLSLIGLPLCGVVATARGSRLLGLGITAWWIVWIAVAAAVSAWFLRIWRCPACGASLGQPPSADVCRKCGVALR